MKKFILTIIVLVTLFGVFLYVKNISDVTPKNYEECVKAGGKTNKDVPRVQNFCEYNGQTFDGPII